MIVKLTERGLSRVLNGQVGMTFLVDSMTPGVAGVVLHVRDYRYPRDDNGKPYQTWSITADDYEIINDDTAP
jgi:hypothetical protein